LVIKNKKAYKNDSPDVQKGTWKARRKARRKARKRTIVDFSCVFLCNDIVKMVG
jgi:hypothetical protein